MKVYISYAHKDSDIALQLSTHLKDRGVDLLGNEKIEPGENWVPAIQKSLDIADAAIFLLTDDAVRSRFVAKELMYLVNQERIILPIIIGDIKMGSAIEYLLMGIQSIYVESKEKLLNALDDIMAYLPISSAIKEQEKQKKAAERKQTEEKVEKSLVANIDCICDKLSQSIKRNKIFSFACYGLSIIALLISILIFFSMRNTAGPTLLETGIVLASRIVVVALIVAACRLFFVLGKSFMVESIRNADRLHAISFGRFFLDAYGNVAGRDEIVQAFQAWNIDGGSSFRTQTTEEFDPKISEWIKRK